MANEKIRIKTFDERQLIVLYYLQNCLKPRVPGRIREKVLKWFGDYDEDWFHPKHVKKIQNMLKKQAHNSALKADNVYAPYTISSARMLMDLELKNRDIEAEWKAINKRIDLIFDIFGIPANVREPLRFIVHHAMENGLRILWDSCSEIGVSDYDINMENQHSIALIANCKPSQVDDCLDPEGPCFEKGILYWDEDYESELTLTRKFRSIIGSELKTKKKILEFILKNKQTANLRPDDFKHIPEIYEHCRELLKNAVEKNRPGVNILLRGETGTGKSELARTIAKDIGADLYAVAEGKDSIDKDDRLAELSMVQNLVGGQSDTVLIFDEAEDIFFNGIADGKNAHSKLFINKILENNKVPTIWTTNAISEMDPAYIRRFMYAPEIPKPDEAATKKIWKNISISKKFKLSDKYIEQMAKTYDISPSFIETGIASAELVGNEKAIERTIESLILATEGHVQKNDDFQLDTFNPNLLNTDINLEDLANRVIKLKKTNFSLFLYGVPGTGKSVYARYLAKKMDIPYIRKRGSDLLDKYVGGTEKLIADAFRTAKDKKAMLIIDEADSFLQDRGRAQRSWEVSEVNEMLTHMEENEYPLVCTTNLTDQIDAAAFRRFNFKVKYDYMKPDQISAAFRHFFGQDIAEAGARELKFLTPGDFAVVRENAEIMGIAGAAELAEMLRKEAAHKHVEKAVGFGR